MKRRPLASILYSSFGYQVYILSFFCDAEAAGGASQGSGYAAGSPGRPA